MLKLGYSQTIEAPGYHVKLALKATLIISVFIVSIVAVLDQFFLEELSKTKLDSVKNNGKGSVLLVTELAKESLLNKNPSILRKSLNNIQQDIIKENQGLLQISVILFPEGIYYSSTRKDFLGKKVHSSLYKKIENHQGWNTVVSKLNYKLGDHAIPVLQFLQKVATQDEQGNQHIATTHILYDYSHVINSTRGDLIIIAILVLIGSILAVWGILIPISIVHNNVVNGLLQVSQNNYEVSLEGFLFDELSTLYQAFNKMTDYLKRESKKSAFLPIPRDEVIQPSVVQESNSNRKVGAACLCIKIPKLQKKIINEAVGNVVDFVDDYLDTFYAVVEENGGQFSRILGDKIHCIFEGSNAIDNSIRAALKCTQTWREINHERKILNQELLDCGIGLHYTSTVIGKIKKSIPEHTVLGEASGIAAQLCGGAKREEILISSSMMEMAGGNFEGAPVIDFKSTSFPEDMEVLFLQNLPREPKAQTLNFEERSLKESQNIPDSSIPSMIKETYDISPLGSVVTEEKIEALPTLKVPEASLDKNTTKNTQKKNSIWDQFGVGTSEEKK